MVVANKHEWCIGESRNELKGNIRDIDRLYADGDELAHILNNVKGIPYPASDHNHLDDPVTRGYGFTWYGDIARTIILNL